VSLGWIAYLPVPGLSIIPWLGQGTDRNARFHAWQGGLLVAMLWLVLIVLGVLVQAAPTEGLRLILGAITLMVLVAYLIAALLGGITAARDRYIRIRPVYDLLTLMKR
jgi:uncharacterized membrane protein